MSRSKIEICATATLGSTTTIGGYYWRLIGGNGETLCHSETYTRRDDAERGAIGARRAMRRARLVSS